MVTLTTMASEKVQDFIKDHGVETDAGLRVAVLPGGCSGFQYGLNIEDGAESDDEILEIGRDADTRMIVDMLQNDRRLQPERILIDHVEHEFSEVVLTGRLDPDGMIIRSSEMSAKCPSKYEEEPGAPQPKGGQQS